MDPKKDSFKDSATESDSSDNESELTLCEWTYVWKIPKFFETLDTQDWREPLSNYIYFPRGGGLGICIVMESISKLHIIGKYTCKEEDNYLGKCSSKLKEVAYRLHFYGCFGKLNNENNWDQVMEFKADDGDPFPDCVDEKIYLRLIFDEQEPHSQLQTVVLQDDVDSFRRLSRELSDARDIDGDVTFEFPAGTQVGDHIQDGERAAKRQNVCLTAHRWLLMARSSVFLTMFNTPMLEAITRKVEIVDFTVQEFELFLQYIYKGYLTPNKNLETYLALSRLAYKYDVPGINEAIRQKIPGMLRLRRTNVIVVLSHADTYQDLELLEKAIDFVVKNAKKLTENTLDFFANNPSLSKKIMTALIDNM